MKIVIVLSNDCPMKESEAIVKNVLHRDNGNIERIMMKSDGFEFQAFPTLPAEEFKQKAVLV